MTSRIRFISEVVREVMGIRSSIKQGICIFLLACLVFTGAVPSGEPPRPVLGREITISGGASLCPDRAYVVPAETAILPEYAPRQNRDSRHLRTSSGEHSSGTIPEESGQKRTGMLAASKEPKRTSLQEIIDHIHRTRRKRP